MSINTIETEGWSTRINYWDGDVLDRKYPGEQSARKAAAEGSLNLRADIDVCHGATVVATYKRGKEAA